MKKLFSAILSFALLVSLLSVNMLTASAVTEYREGYYTYTVSNNKATITDCDNRVSGDIVIPSTLGGCTVTSIGDDAFRDCKSLTSINLPDGVTSIGNGAFSSCSSLTSINIPDSVTSIGKSAFSQCNNLISITLPVIGGSETEDRFFGYFFGMSSYKELTYGKIPSSLKNVILTDSCKGVPPFAFNGCSFIESIIIHGNYIGKRAFHNCTNLTNVYILNNVTNIAEEAFLMCKNLSDIVISKSVSYVYDRAFYGCEKLSDIWYTGNENDFSELERVIKDYSYNNSNYWLIKATWHYDSCPIGAPHNYDNACDDTCNNCGKIRTVPNHIYENQCDTTCNICGYVRKVPEHIYDNSCDTTCNICRDIRVTKHKYYRASDRECVVCHYIRTLNSIEVTLYPKKIYYLENKDILDTSGGEITLYYDDGSSGILDITENMVTGFNNSIVGEQILTVTYCNKKATFIVKIVEKSLESITVSSLPLKTTYYIGDSLDTSGIELKLIYNNGETATVRSGFTTSGFSSATAGTKTIVVYYDNLTDAFSVNVKKLSIPKTYAPTVATKTHNTVTLTATAGYEYKMDNGEWQDSNVFGGLNPNEKHTFYQRVKETDTTHASESSLGTAITTDKMSVATPNAPTIETKTHNSVTLKKVEGCEYSMDGINWQSSNVFENLNPETEYTFYQRTAETDTSYASQSSAGLTVKTDTLVLPPKETLIYENGVWYYTVDGEKVNDTTLVYYNGTWYYVENGVVNWGANTLCYYGGDWYYIENGEVSWNTETLCYYYGSWYYVNYGVVNWGANTLCYYGGDWYYIENGEVNWNTETLCYYYGTWYYVNYGVVNWGANTLCYYGGDWYYIENGEVSWNTETLCYYYGSWYYVNYGVVNWGANTLCYYYGDWYYIENGMLNWNADLYFNYYGTDYKVVGGIVRF